MGLIDLQIISEFCKSLSHRGASFSWSTISLTNSGRRLPFGIDRQMGRLPINRRPALEDMEDFFQRIFVGKIGSAGGGRGVARHPR